MLTLFKAFGLFFSLSPAVGLWVGIPALGLLLGAGVIPLLEWFVGRPGRGVFGQWSADDQPGRWGAHWPRLIAVLVLVQAPVVMFLAADSLTVVQLLLLGASLGFVAGGTGIVLGHELGHRRSRIDRVLSLALLTQVAYGHYQLEHNRGHHRRAATFEDPASARVDEDLPRFFLRYFPGVWQGACSLARQELRSSGGTMRPQGLLAVFVVYAVLLTLLAGGAALLLMLMQALVAQYLVGTVDYIEHWGLRRARTDGRDERIGAAHVWDCPNRVSELLLFNLPRHSHHHLNPSDDADHLLRMPASPQMPTGYAGMVLLASVPPLFRKVMLARLPGSGLQKAGP